MVFLAGMSTGALAQFISSPVDLVKVIIYPRICTHQRSPSHILFLVVLGSTLSGDTRVAAMLFYSVVKCAFFLVHRTNLFHGKKEKTEIYKICGSFTPDFH